MVRKLPRDFADGWRPLRQPLPWLQDTVAYLVRDHLARLGPSAAELARILEGSEGVTPDFVVAELRRRPVDAAPLPMSATREIVKTALGDEIRDVEPAASTTPITQLHPATLKDGTAVVLRVRRPGVERAVRLDARITATMLAPWEWLLPPLRDAHPLGIIELGVRQLLEEADVRNEALNAVELGLAIEDLAISEIVPMRPLPGLVTPTVVVFEALDGAVPLADGLDRVDRQAATSALVRLTLESALTHGVFHADLGTDQLMVLPDGRLALTGYSTVGRLDDTTRQAALQYVMALLCSDGPGQVAAMRAIGAVPDGLDEAALIADLDALDLPDLMAVLAGAEFDLASVIRPGLGLMVRHRLRPPTELLLFVRAVLSLRALLAVIDPEAGLLTALLPLLPRLPTLLGDAMPSNKPW